MNRRLELVTLGQPLVFTEKPIPRAPDNGYIVKVMYTGICLTDHHASHGQLGQSGPDKLPVVLGHEISGVIMERGESAIKARPDIDVGHKVAVYSLAMCGDCADCKADRSPYCDSRNKTIGVTVDGGYQQYVVLHDCVNVFPVPDGCPMDTAATAGCAGLTAWNAVYNVRDSVDRNLAVRGKATVLIVGAGGLGYWAVEICKLLWPVDKVKVCAVDVLDEKLSVIKCAGADVVHKWNMDAPDLEEAASLVDLLEGHVDAAIDFVGMTSSFRRIYHCLRKNGSLAVVGASAGGVITDISLIDLILKGITVRGSLYGSRHQFEELIKLVAAKQLHGPPIEHISLEKVNETLAVVGEGKQRGRAVVRLET